MPLSARLRTPRQASRSSNDRRSPSRSSGGATGYPLSMKRLEDRNAASSFADFANPPPTERTLLGLVKQLRNWDFMIRNASQKELVGLLKADLSGTITPFLEAQLKIAIDRDTVSGLQAILMAGGG